jgi:dTMP kinase
MAAGCFVVIEGPEGAGKSTLIRALGARLAAEGRAHTLVREPGGTPLAEAARRAVLDPEHRPGPVAELFLFLAARADLVAAVIRPALDRGEVVIADRFDLSTMAYQVAGRGLDGATVRQANDLAKSGTSPDITLVLDLDPAAGRERQRSAGKAPDRMEQEDPAFHDRLAQHYRAATGPGVEHLDAAVGAEALAAAAWRILAQHRPDLFT